MKGMRFIPTRMHGAMDYLVGALLIAAPWIFQFSDNGAAKWTSIGVGIAMLGASMMTNYELGVIRIIPMHAHLVMDAILGVFLAASPWIVGYSTEGSNAWAPMLVIGILELGAAAMSSPWPERRDLYRKEEDLFRHAARA